MTCVYSSFNAKLWSQCLLLMTLRVLWICPWSRDEINLIACLSADNRKAQFSLASTYHKNLTQTQTQIMDSIPTLSTNAASS